jgi:hypothetical protein
MKKENLLALQKVLICEMCKTTKSLQSDFIIDVNRMNVLNEKNELTGKKYMLFRACGTVFEDTINIERIKFFRNQFPECVLLEIDFDKLASIDMDEAGYYSTLMSDLDFEAKFKCVTKIF